MSYLKNIRHNYIPQAHNSDHPLMISFLCLMIFGLAMVSSASLNNSYEIFEKSGREHYYLWKQFKSLILSLMALGIFQNIPYFKLKKLAIPALFLSITGLVLVLIPWIRADYGTSHSWIIIPFLGSIQPIEFSKIALIIYLASWMSARETDLNKFVSGFLPFCIIVLSHIILLAQQPDYGSVLVLSLFSGIMFFVAGANLLHLALGVSISSIAIKIIFDKYEYIRNRFLGFLDPTIDPEGIGYHIKQALIAIGSGGLFGLGFGQSRQKFSYLPEGQGDSIFAIMSEELGLFRTLILVCTFLFIAYKGYTIAKKSSDNFGKLLAIGITSWFVLQAFLNIAVNLSIAPITGITLPFISFGGSSLLAVGIASGILLNISRYTK